MLVGEYAANDSGNSNENECENGDLRIATVICSNSLELHNDANRSGITRNTSKKLEIYRYLKLKAKTTVIMITVVIVFYVCWTPLAIASILYAFDLPASEFGLVIFACFPLYSWSYKTLYLQRYEYTIL